MKSNIINKTLDEVLHQSMIPYAEYVILDRALPRVEDGLKPVQRRILYTMLELNLEPDKPFRKSARIVGDCLGKYHPHGDRSVYDAMIRMAQDFSIRNTLVHGHGNLGSIDGDSPAAMRYTEAKLTPLAMELLRDLEKECIPFSLNFDDTLKEPDILPARFPNLLVNGSSGIAVGLATNIPPHNLTEVIDGVIAYIENQNITLEKLMQIIKGPDFPSGGYCIAGDELKKAYENGRGKVIMRAKVAIENAENDRKEIVITELPYQVNKAALLEKIAKLKDDKPDLLKGIADIVDESDRNGMRAIIKVKKDANANDILALLLKYTDLQCTFGINMVAIAEGKPRQLGLIDMIKYYVMHQIQVVVAKTKYEYDKAKQREHILNGLVIACRNIDEVIRIIRRSPNTSDAKESLKMRFNLTDLQAQAILDMRLARLTSLEIYKLETELEELRLQIDKLKNILESEEQQQKVVISQLRDIRKKYKEFRRTVIVDDENKLGVVAPTAVKIVQDCVIILTESGELKRLSEKTFNRVDTDSLDIVDSFVTKDSEFFYAFSSCGNCFRLDPKLLKEQKLSDKGKTIHELIVETIDGEKILKIMRLEDLTDKTELIFFTSSGFVKKTLASEYMVAKTCFSSIKLRDDKVLAVQPFSSKQSMLLVTKKGYALNAETSDVPTQGRISGGVRAISLDESDEVIFATQTNGKGVLILTTTKGKTQKLDISKLGLSARYRKGSVVVKGEIEKVERK